MTACATPTAVSTPQAVAKPIDALKPAAPNTGYGTVNAKTGLPDIDPAKVQGNIITAGSSTVFPLTQRIAEIFKDEGYKGQITIDSIGTGAGFERFCKGESDISNASAKISDKQIDACKANNITPVEFRVATDSLAVVINPKNTWATNMKQSQIADAFSGKAKTWKDLDSNWPDKKIILYSPGTDSGTFDYFVEHFYKKDKKMLLDAKPQMSEDDNVLVQGVSGDENAIGYFGYAFFVPNKGKLTDVKVDGIEASKENVDNGKYPLARPLFIYSTAKIMKEKPQVAAFINFYLTRVGDGLKKVAYFPAPEADITKSKTNWLDAVK